VREFFAPGRLGAAFVLPRARGIKKLYLDLCGIPDVRVQLTASYALAALSDLRFASLLDAGCGNGMVTCLIASAHPRAAVEGIDTNADALAFARRLAGEQNLGNVRFTLANAETAAVDGHYDAVTCFAVLQFIKDERTLLETFHRLLSPEGHLILQLPLAGHPGYLMRSGRLRRHLPAFHEARAAFTIAETRRLLERSGFTIDSIDHVIKGSSIVAKELYYLSRAVHPAMAYLLSPLLNWITVFDRRYSGDGQGLFVVARKSKSVAAVG